MLDEGKFGLMEAVSITAIAMTSKIFFTNVGILVRIVGTAVWLSSLISCLISVFFFLLLYKLMARFPGKNIFEVFNEVIGRPITIILGSAYVIYLIYYSGSNTREFVEMIRAYSLPDTPTSILVLLVIVVAAILCFYGLECIARISTIFFIPIILGLIILFSLAYKLYDATLLRPYLGYGVYNTANIGFFRSSGYSEFLILAVIIGSMPNVKCFKRAGLISISFTGVIFVVSFALYVMAFGYVVGGENMAGMFELSRAIYFNRFFQRIESIFLFMWVISSVLTISISFYIALSSFCKVFHLSNYKPLMFPAAYLVFMVSMLPANLIEVVDVNIRITRQWSMIGLYFIPALILLAAIVLRKGGKSCRQKN